MHDILITDRGAEALLRPLTLKGKKWAKQHVDYVRESEGAIVIDSFEIRDIAAAADKNVIRVRVDYES